MTLLEAVGREELTRIREPGLAVDVLRGGDPQSADVHVRGRLDGRTAPLVAAVLDHLRTQGVSSISLDVAHVIVASKSGLSDVRAVQRSFEESGGKLVLGALRQHAVPLLTEAGLLTRK
jgi:anti-anti-sigma regulatory factor